MRQSLSNSARSNLSRERSASPPALTPCPVFCSTYIANFSIKIHLSTRSYRFCSVVVKLGTWQIFLANFCWSFFLTVFLFKLLRLLVSEIWYIAILIESPRTFAKNLYQKRSSNQLEIILSQSISHPYLNETKFAKFCPIKPEL